MIPSHDPNYLDRERALKIILVGFAVAGRVALA